jgi:hypothetical protein
VKRPESQGGRFPTFFKKDFRKIFGKTEGLVKQNGRIGEAKRKDW